MDESNRETGQEEPASLVLAAPESVRCASSLLRLCCHLRLGHCVDIEHDPRRWGSGLLSLVTNQEILSSGQAKTRKESRQVFPSSPLAVACPPPSPLAGTISLGGCALLSASTRPRAPPPRQLPQDSKERNGWPGVPEISPVMLRSPLGPVCSGGRGDVVAPRWPFSHRRKDSEFPVSRGCAIPWDRTIPKADLSACEKTDASSFLKEVARNWVCWHGSAIHQCQPATGVSTSRSSSHGCQ